MGSIGNMGRLPLAFMMLASSTSLLGGCATAAAPSATSVGGGNEAVDYYPLLANWGWAFEIERGGERVLALYSVVERSVDRAVVKNGDDRIVYAVLPDGIARREGGLIGDFLIRTPVRKGTSWAVASGEAEVVDTGLTITLPSGTYPDCALVEEVRRDPERVTRTSYCRGIGPVEIEMRVLDSLKKTYETVAHARLLGVTRPEADP
jgi:hypothetical protein